MNPLELSKKSQRCKKCSAKSKNNDLGAGFEEKLLDFKNSFILTVTFHIK